MKYGIFASIGPGLPVMISWRETEALAQLVAKRYRRIHKLVQVFKVGIILDVD
jgi:hypothetical protein